MPQLSFRRSATALVVAITLASPAVAQRGAPPNRAIDRKNLDTTCAACEDFYTFANGGWLKTTKMPATYPSYGAFAQLFEQNEKVMNELLESSARDVRAGTASAGADRYRVGAYYAACMDTTTIESMGTRSIDASIRRISAIGSRDDLVRALAELERSDGLAPYGVGAESDAKNSNAIIVGAGQGGLSLPNRDYYVRADDQSKQMRAAFQAHVERMFKLLGDADATAKANAATVLAMEARFAEVSMDPVTLRDPNAVYHKMRLAEFEAMTPNLKWSHFLVTQKAPAITDLNVSQPEFFKAMNGFVADLPLDDWKTLLRWRLARAHASYLPKRFRDENFSFNKLLTGQQEQLPRWQSCTRRTDQALGEALGQEYVKKAFSPEAKARAKAIVDNMVAVLRDRIQELEWMGPATKQQALGKLNSFTRKIGYPDKWQDYSALNPTPGEYLENARRMSAYNTARGWSKVGKPVDKTEWGMSPPTVNAYYNPSWNEIVFPAGILLPPFFDPNADDAVNYGAMGAVIGHEMTHGFDDQGRQYDASGNLRDWWTKDDADKFNAEAQKVVAQFDRYTVVDTATHVNGKLTLGENIADLGGLKIAYAAMQRALKEKGRPGPIDGFTPEQRFFLGWAQVWRSLDRPEFLRYLVQSDEHSPAQWRVNGPLSNMAEFKAAWGCKDGDKMVRADALKARIW
jgi:putative endopeptidase